MDKMNTCFDDGVENKGACFAAYSGLFGLFAFKGAIRDLKIHPFNDREGVN